MSEPKIIESWPHQAIKVGDTVRWGANDMGVVFGFAQPAGDHSIAICGSHEAHGCPVNIKHLKRVGEDAAMATFCRERYEEMYPGQMQ